jgi:hypothetical protein
MMIDWFLTTRLVQWLSVLLTGWCVVREDDPRIHLIEGAVSQTTQDTASTARKSRGLFSGWWPSQRWDIFLVQGSGPCYVMVETPKGRLLVYRKKAYFHGDKFALGSCRNPMEVFLLAAEPGQGVCAQLSNYLPLDDVDRNLPEHKKVDWI